MRIGQRYRIQLIFLYSYIAIVLSIAPIGCRKFYPVDKESIGFNSDYRQTVFKPVLGRPFKTVNNFDYGASSNPAEFKIINPRLYNGDKASIFLDTFKVLTWKAEYTGLEKTLEEINQKRETQYRPLFEVNKHSGDFYMWPEASSKYFKTFPDSCYLFDVEYSNSGGRRYYRNLKLIPYKERPYEPINLNDISGVVGGEINHPDVSGKIYGKTSGFIMGGNEIEVYFNKKYVSNKRQLTIKIFDQNYNYINLDNFSDTKWEEILHGFNMVKTDTTVTYNVAYPIPLRKHITKYTNPSGEMARVVLGYTRLGVAQAIERPRITFDFAIYEPGDWEIIFRFKKDTPKFENE